MEINSKARSQTMALAVEGDRLAFFWVFFQEGSA
jgi:hypothetical protein